MSAHVQVGMWKKIGLVIALLLALAGCASTNAPASGPSISDPVPSPKPSGIIVVEFQRQGGLAGVSDDLVVRDDGGYTVTRTKPPVSRSGQLDVTAYQGLVKTLERTNVVSSAPSGGVADGYTYRLTYNGRHVVARDGAMDPAVRPLLDLLTGIVQRYGS